MQVLRKKYECLHHRIIVIDTERNILAVLCKNKKM